MLYQGTGQITAAAPASRQFTYGLFDLRAQKSETKKHGFGSSFGCAGIHGLKSIASGFKHIHSQLRLSVSVAVHARLFQTSNC